MVRVIGLTGGIASGKSTVARLLAALGAEVIDADQVARDVVEPGQPALAELVAAFGAEILDAGGRLDRRRLAAVAFADETQRARLNAITHPRIAAETARRVAEAAARGVEVVIYEASLLVENGAHRALAGLVVVAAAEAAQIARARARDGLSEEEVRRRIAAQAPLAARLAVADWVIHNDGDPDALAAAVRAVWDDIRAGGPRRGERGR